MDNQREVCEDRPRCNRAPRFGSEGPGWQDSGPSPFHAIGRAPVYLTSFRSATAADPSNTVPGACRSGNPRFLAIVNRPYGIGGKASGRRDSAAGSSRQHGRPDLTQKHRSHKPRVCQKPRRQPVGKRERVD